MKNLVIALMLSSALPCFSQNITGSWIGALEFGIQKLNLVFHLQKDSNGNDICTMDSPDQGAKDIPTTINYLSADSINISIAKIGMTYSGRMKDKVINGTFMQNGMKLPLILKSGSIVRNRPQNPVAPFPYQTENITFTNAHANATLAGTLTYPVGYKKGNKVPVVLMVTGSGLQNRDEEVFDHKPFLIIADYLARNGIATLRYDDRGYGESTGDASTATTRDFADDAEAGIQRLRKMEEFSIVGVLGHSEGASIAFMLGASQKVDFVISLAGIGVKGDTALTAQANRISELMGHPMNMSVKQYRTNITKKNIPWLNYFLDYDPSADIKATHCPVMAINGAKDVQVIASLNLPGIKKSLPPNKKDFIKEYPGMNHLFQTCKTGLTDEYANIDETVSPIVLKDIAGWIHSLLPELK